MLRTIYFTDVRQNSQMLLDRKKKDLNFKLNRSDVKEMVGNVITFCFGDITKR